MEGKKVSFLYKIVRWLVWLFAPKFRLVGTENLPKESCVVVGNHSQMFGPIAGELYFPGRHAVWCAGQMMRRGEVAAYAFEDFWSFKPKWTHGYFRLLSHLITPLSLLIFNNADTIAVYHDTRLRTTYRQSVEALQNGRSMIIFPEYNRRFNNILYAFQDKFVDLARFYHRKTGKELDFVPMYVAPRLKTVFFGEPVRFRADAPIEDERERICREMAGRITAMAAAQPVHTVVPYRNIPKKDYPTNIPVEVYSE